MPSLFPRDAVLNLPPLGYSWGLQRLAEMFCRAVSYEQAHEFVLAATGVSIGKRQLEQITMAAAADAERFYQDRNPWTRPPPARRPGRGAGEQEQGLPPLAISADGKGVAMLPEARRRRTKAPEQRVRTFDKRAGTGEKKGCKRMAETGCVFDVIAAGAAADPGAGHAPGPRPPPRQAPRAENRWYACDITAGRDVTIGKIFDEADRRDPGHLPDLDRPGRRRHLPARPDPGPGRRPRHHPDHPDRLHPRAGIPVEDGLVLPRRPATPPWKTG